MFNDANVFCCDSFDKVWLKLKVVFGIQKVTHFFVRLESKTFHILTIIYWSRLLGGKIWQCAVVLMSDKNVSWAFI